MAKTPFIKVIIAILLLSLMLPLAVACGEAETTAKKPNETTAPTTEGPDTPSTTGPKVTTTTPTTQLAYPAQLEGIKDDLEDTVVQFIYVEGE